jgi:BlaI family penicillinase repressor
MNRFPDLTEADFKIMEILWRGGETSSAAILKEVEQPLGWTRQTVRTYLKRLMDKGLVGARETRKKVFAYYAAVPREDYAADKAGGLYSQYYGSLSHMVAGIVRNERISDDELAALEETVKRLRSKEE